MRSGVLICRAALSALAQQPAEVSSEETTVTFQSRVNLVLVPAVVRDRAGNPVGTLRQEDFQLFDNGKPQIITKFSVENSGAKSGGNAGQPAPTVEWIPGEPATSPDHFAAWLFDDVHLKVADLTRARDAAEKYLTTSLRDNGRMAIYTTSGQTTLNFTDDRDELRRTLMQLLPHPITRSNFQECPDISFYMAEQIQSNSTDIFWPLNQAPEALGAAIKDTLVCLKLENLPPPDTGQIPPAVVMAHTQVVSAIRDVLQRNEHETQISMSALKDLVRRMSAMPGQRNIVLVSPGFLRMDEQLHDENDIIDQAVRANVTISSLDARGLYAVTPDITSRVLSIQTEEIKQRYARESARKESEVMAALTAGTGAIFFQGNNNLAQGFEKLSTAPDVYYLLGYAPQNLKLDGGYHTIKVTVKTPLGLSTQARRGYYAPNHQTNAVEEVKEEISQALFSREEMHDIPVEIHTQFFKASEAEARLAVLAQVDIGKLRFRKIEGRNGDEMTVVAGLFDRNGNFVQGLTKTITMRLKDETLAGKVNSGITVRSDFKVAPGVYAIRLVVRDAEGQMMAARNGAVEIP